MSDCFVDFSMAQYLKVTGDGRVIAFDSGEHSDRRQYIVSALSYLINVKGVPAVVISTVSEKSTKAYLNKLPQALRSKVLSLGVFHLYLNVLAKMRLILDQIYISKSYRGYMQHFFSAMRSIQIDLIRKLNQQGFVCILDRSIISNYCYYRAVTGESDYMSNSKVFTLKDFNPVASFFVNNQSKRSTGFVKGQMYDSLENINYSIKAILPTLVNECEKMTILPSTATFEQNMNTIRSVLSKHF